jgi:hypothetical protein
VADAAFTEMTTVARCAQSRDDFTPTERDRRVRVIAEVFHEETRKYRERGFYTDEAKECAASFPDEPRNAQLWRSNVIRAFFIANGRRLLPEHADWMRTP